MRCVRRYYASHQATAATGTTQVSTSTRILGRRTAPFSPFVIKFSYRVPHGFYPKILVLTLTAQAVLWAVTHMGDAAREQVRFSSVRPEEHTGAELVFELEHS